MEVSIQEVIDHKKLSPQELEKEWKKIEVYHKKFKNQNKNSFVGNKIIYHFMLEHLLEVKKPNGKSFIEIMNDPELKNKLIDQVQKRNRTGTLPNRMFECWRINTGSIVFFKVPQSIYLYTHFGATKVLDPTAGWGGRALGAIVCGIQYTGIDTNINLKSNYDKMLDGKKGIKMIWENCLNVDFSKIDYDFVLTSPPYANTEIYPHMTPWKDSNDFHTNFLIPLINKCREHCKGKVCINISPQLYKQLTVKHKYPLCSETIDLKEQKNGKTPDNIYIWN